MGRIKQNTPNIIALSGALELFRQAVKLPEPDQLNEAQFTNGLAEALVKAEVLKGSQSKALTNKLRGLPLEEREEDASGIEIEKLDKLVLVLKEKYGLFPDFSLEDLKFPWATFEKEIFPTPSYLEDISTRAYYKFLSPSERISVDRYVHRKVGEIMPGSSYFYNVYLWDSQEKCAAVALLQLNRTKRLAAYVEYAPLNETEWVPNKVLSTVYPSGDAYKVGESSLELQLENENPSISYANAHCSLFINSLEFYGLLPFIKGVMTFSFENSKPISATIVLQRQKNLKEALDVIKDKEKRELALSYAVLDYRGDMSESNLTEIKKLATYPTYKLIEEITGCYSYVFIIETVALKTQGNIGVGTCNIFSDGVVVFDIQSQGTLKCFIEPIYINNDFICISHFMDDGNEPIKYDYKLKIIRDEIPGKHEVLGLEGKYSSIFRGKVVIGEVIFTKQSHWKRLRDAKAALPAASFDPEDKLPKIYKPYTEIPYAELIRRKKERRAKKIIDQLTFDE